MKHLFQPLLDWYLQSLKSGGYALVALLMAIESSIVPLPSEVVIPPAAHLAWTEGIDFLGVHLTGWSAQIGLVIAGTIGSWIGATAMYWVSRVAGRPFVMRYGKYFFISPAKVEGAERWAADYGAFGIFASRLLPVVRHLIGIPAGIVRMSYLTFSIYTVLGSAVWCGVLCWLGVKIGADINKGEMHRVTFWLLGFVGVVGVLYYLFVHRQMKGKKG
ncbi:MAG TPA: DedA family protein [Candidatus Paceibacterota bacterium]|nr:DedA family protein [Candidatus Paceibacterota bacterium]